MRIGACENPDLKLVRVGVFFCWIGFWLSVFRQKKKTDIFKKTNRTKSKYQHQHEKEWGETSGVTLGIFSADLAYHFNCQ